MRKIWSVTASAAVVVLCGCQFTDVDQISASEGRQDWYQDIRANYPGFQPPRLISPGISGQTGPAVRNANVDDNAANNADNGDVEALPIDPVQPAEPAKEPEAKAEVKAEEKTEAKAEVKAEEKTEAKAEAKAEVKAEEKTEAKAEVKAEEKTEAKKIEPPDPTSSDIYVVQYGDTLGALSKKFYGSVRYVNVLQKANSDIITNANVLKPGMKLIIPKL